MNLVMLLAVALLVILLLGLAISYVVSGRPAIIASRVVIERPLETVFDYVADMRNELQWNPDVQIMEKKTEGPIGKGTRFNAKWHLSGVLEVEITRYERPHHITFVNGGPLEVTLDLDLYVLNNQQTQINAQFKATPHGFLRAIFPIMRRKLSSQEAKNMTNLKKGLEGV